MSKRSNKIFNSIKEKWNANYDERQEQKEIKKLIKSKKETAKEELLWVN